MNLQQYQEDTLKKFDEEFAIIVDEKIEGITYKNRDYGDFFGQRKDVQSFLKEALKGQLEVVVKGLPKELPEKVIECCDNCREKGWGKSWYGKGKETGDNWRNRYYPTGSYVFCKECFMEHGQIGQEWEGEEIWKTTSKLPEHDEIRINHITKNSVENKSFNTALSSITTPLLEEINKYDYGNTNDKLA
jgi:hypothetical protein